MAEVLVFDAETKAASLDLDTLDRTLKFEESTGKMPESRPVEHAELLRNIFAIANKNTEWEPQLQPIVIKNDRCRRIKWKGEKDQCPVENYLIERLVAKIDLKGSESFTDVSNAAGLMSVGISYNERGIQVAFGHNVRICENLNVFGKYVFTTYGGGDNKLSFFKGMELLEKWMKDGANVQQENQKNITALMNTQVTEQERLRVFGKLYELAIRGNEDSTIDAPLNVTECGKMVRAGLPNIIKPSEEGISAWDLTNWATSVLKPQSSDMLTLLEKNNRLNNFFLQEFSLSAN